MVYVAVPMRTISLFAALTCVGCGAAQSTIDAGATPGADAGAVAQTIHGCTSSAYVDGRTGDRQIGFGTALGSPALGYSPNCLIISAGQTVTWVGNFSVHPLVGGEYRGDAGTSPTPIVRVDTGSDPKAVTFATPGLYPYYCDNHAPTMEGVVWVQ